MEVKKNPMKTIIIVIVSIAAVLGITFLVLKKITDNSIRDKGGMENPDQYTETTASLDSTADTEKK